MILRISSSAFADCLSNVRLFRESKDGRFMCGDTACVIGRDGTVTFYSTDNYVAIQSSTSGEVIEDDESNSLAYVRVFPASEIDRMYDLSKAIKDLKSNPGYIRFEASEECATVSDWSEDVETPVLDVENPFTDMLIDLFNDFELETPGVLAFRPERFAKFWKIKAPKDVPMDCTFGRVEDPRHPSGWAYRMYIRIGPNVRVVASGLNRITAIEAATAAGISVENSFWYIGDVVEHLDGEEIH